MIGQYGNGNFVLEKRRPVPRMQKLRLAREAFDVLVSGNVEDR
jgi:hypothetical protein